MRVVSRQVFDDVIAGTGSTWYTPAELSSVLGAADYFAVQACWSVATGTATLTIQSEHSADDDTWVATGSAELNGVSLNPSEGSAFGYRDVNSSLLSHIRFKITLGGTSPRCRLKLYFTGHAKSGRT